MEVALDQLMHDREILTRVLQMAVTKKPLWIGKQLTTELQCYDMSLTYSLADPEIYLPILEILQITA